MADLCERCGVPITMGDGCDDSSAPHDADVIALACRERELANTRAALTATRALLERSRLLLVKSRDALDLAVFELGELEGGTR